MLLIQIRSLCCAPRSCWRLCAGAFRVGRQGELLGAKVHAALTELLGRAQVYDLRHEREPAARVGDIVAVASAAGVRVVVAGGDGSCAWVLGALADAGMANIPVAILPLGTGNDLSRVAGWGGGFLTSGTSSVMRQRLLRRLHAVARAPEGPIDRWDLRLAIQGGGSGAGAAAAAAAAGGLPPAFRCTPECEAATARVFNYLSVGMDAEIAFGYHQGRPKTAKGKSLLGTAWLSYVSSVLQQGWLASSTKGCCGSRARVARRVGLQVRNGDDGAAEWRSIALPLDTTAIVLLNIDSYASGRRLWKQRWSSGAQGGYDELGELPEHDDGRLEVVAIRGGLHLAGIVSHASGATRLAQASAVRLRIGATPGGRSSLWDQSMCIQLDGEPWRQRLDTNGPVELEITHSGRSSLLVGPEADMIAEVQQ